MEIVTVKQNQGSNNIEKNVSSLEMYDIPIWMVIPGVTQIMLLVAELTIYLLVDSLFNDLKKNTCGKFLEQLMKKECQITEF